MSSWRPEQGWANPFGAGVFSSIPVDDLKYQANGTVTVESCREEVAYELGADAMLEALKKEGHESYGTRGKGWFVFIPEVQP